MTTNAQEWKGRWSEIKGRLKQKYSKLTDNDLEFLDGKREELFGRLAQKLGKKKDEIRDEIEKL